MSIAKALRASPWTNTHGSLGYASGGLSAGWGVSKPAPAYFTRVATAMGCAPADIVHVGDRVDNDVVPAAEAGMLSVFIRRGPWAFIQRGWPGVEQARIAIDSLAELPAAVRALEP